MHIGIVTETFLPEINGVAITLYRLTKALATLGHQVTLIRPKQATHSSFDLHGNITQLLVPGLKLPKYKTLHFGLPVIRSIKKAFRTSTPDAIYIATEGPLGWAALYAAKHFDMPIASGYHTHFDEFFKHYRLTWLSSITTSYLRAFHNRTHATLVPTEEMSSSLKQLNYNNVIVYERDVDTNLFNPNKRSQSLRKKWNASEETIVILFVGRIAPEKNLDLTTKAYRAFAATCPIQTKFVWVGDGPQKDHMNQQNPDFIFCGMQINESLAEHYASADIVLFASATETFGNITLEGLASGLCVVAYDYAAAKQHITHEQNGILAPYNNDKAFITSCEELAKNIDSITKIRKQARLSVENLGVKNMSQQFVSILTNLDKKIVV